MVCKPAQSIDSIKLDFNPKNTAVALHIPPDSKSLHSSSKTGGAGVKGSRKDASRSISVSSKAGGASKIVSSYIQTEPKKKKILVNRD